MFITEFVFWPSLLYVGDHYVHVKIDAPKVLNDKQKALMMAWAEVESDTPGTVTGFTYTKSGSKVTMEDDPLVADIREALEEAEADSGKQEDKGKEWSFFFLVVCLFGKKHATWIVQVNQEKYMTLYSLWIFCIKVTSTVATDNFFLVF